MNRMMNPAGASSWKITVKDHRQGGTGIRRQPGVRGAPAQGENSGQLGRGSDFSEDGKTLEAEFPLCELDQGPFRPGFISKPQRIGFQMREPFYAYLRIR